MAEDNDGIRLSRRKALAGLGSIGAATALGGVGTFAQFTDTEADDVTFTAGGIDGHVQAGARYNGNVIQDFSGTDFTDKNEDSLDNVGFEESGAIGLDFNLTDVKPGDYGCFAFKITVENNPAWVAACLGYANDTDAAAYEPEADVDGNHAEVDKFGPKTDYDSPGELAESILTIPFYKGASAPSSGSKFDPCIFFDDEDETFDHMKYEGSQAVQTPTQFWDNSEDGLVPATLHNAAGFKMLDTQAWNDSTDTHYDVDDSITVDSGCVFLNGDNPSYDNQQGAAPLKPGDEIWMGWDWHIPFDVGNVVQGDSLDLQLGFVFGQTRHTESAELSNIYSPGDNTPN